MSTYQFELSSEEIDRYHQEGYLVPSFQFPDTTVSAMREAYDELLARNPTIDSDLMLGPHLEKPGAQGVKGSKKWLEFATHPELLDIAQQLVGEDLILWATTIWGKPPKCGKETPWHQDGDYYPISPMETITIWIALDDATVENGCMQFIPGSHKQRRLFPHHWVESDGVSIQQVCDEEYFDASTAVNLELKAGQVSFHDVYLVHRSQANHSDKRRAAVAVRIMPGHCHFDHELGKQKEAPHRHHDYSARPLHLLRGQDRTGKNDFTIGH